MSPVSGFITTTLPRIRIVGAHRRGNFALRHELQALVERQRERGAGLGGNRSLRRDAAAVHVGEQAYAAGRAAKFLVQALLDAGVALLLEIHRSQHVSGKRAVRIMALAFVGEADPVDARFQVQQIVILFRTELPLDDQIAAVRVGGLFDLHIEFGAVQVQQVAEKIAGHADIYFHGIDEDGARCQAHRQRPAVAVEDRAARRGYLLHHFLYGAGPYRILAVVKDLQRDRDF